MNFGGADKLISAEMTHNGKRVFDIDANVREYWTCQDSTTDQCEKTTKAIDVNVELETTKKSIKAKGGLRSTAAASLSGHVSFETSGTEDSFGVEMSLVKDLAFSNPTPGMKGLKMDTVIKSQGQEVFSSSASLNLTPGVVFDFNLDTLGHKARVGINKANPTGGQRLVDAEYSLEGQMVSRATVQVDIPNHKYSAEVVVSSK